MKAVLLYANDDASLQSRLQAAIVITQTFGGHLTCVHVTPHNAFISGDPFGGFYASPQVVEQLGTDEEAHRTGEDQLTAAESMEKQMSGTRGRLENLR